MKGIRVDKLMTSVEDLLGLLPNMIAKVPVEDMSENVYVKVWRFFEENNNPETVRSTGMGLFEKIEFKKNEGYLGMVLFQEMYAEESLPEVFEQAAGIGNLSPRGICGEFTKDKGAGNVHFSMFVANGKNSGALVKAILLTRAFELEAHLNKHPSLLPALYSGIYIKSKKITKSDTITLSLSSKKPTSPGFLTWLISDKSPASLSHFKSHFLNKDPNKLYMNPFGVTLHKPKVSSLSLKGIQTKFQEKEQIADITSISQLEDLEIRDTTRNELTLEFYSEKISELVPGLYVSGEAVARNKDLLKSSGVTHIINCAGNVCENYFPEDFVYTKLYIKDSSTYNIDGLFYPLYCIIENTLAEGGKVLVHCMQGVSRSVSLCIGYIIFTQRQSYEEVLDNCKNIRQICSPNIGFQVQLLWWYKRLNEEYHSIPADPRVFLVSTHDPEQPCNVTAKLSMQSSEEFTLDPRGVFVVHNETVFCIWIGAEVPRSNLRSYSEVAKKHTEFLQKFEKCGEFSEMGQGEESEEFWSMWEDRPGVGKNKSWDQVYVLLGEEVEESERYSSEEPVVQEKFRESGEEFEHSEPEIQINDEEGSAKLDLASGIDEIGSKCEKISVRPDNTDYDENYSKEDYSKVSRSKGDFFIDDKEGDCEEGEGEVGEKRGEEGKEEEFKVKMFVYPEIEGIAVFDDEELAEDAALCICTKKKCFIWRGNALDQSLETCKEYLNIIVKAFYGEIEIEIAWEQAGEESQEFLDLFN